MSKIELIKELVARLNKASEAYYKYDNPIMSDKEYDSLFNIILFEAFVDLDL